GQVADGDRVGPAGGVQVDHLNASQVHGDRAEVAGEPDPTAVGRDVERLCQIRAVKGQRVPAAAPVHHVAAVAGTPYERVVAGAARQRVVASRAVQDVAHGAADQDIVAGAAVELRQRQCAVGLVQREGVVAGAAVCEDQARVGYGCRTTLDDDGAAVH